MRPQSGHGMASRLGHLLHRLAKRPEVREGVFLHEAPTGLGGGLDLSDLGRELSGHQGPDQHGADPAPVVLAPEPSPERPLFLGQGSHAAPFRERLPWPKRAWVEPSLEETPTHAWRQALTRKIQDVVGEFAEAATAALQARVRTERDDQPSLDDARC
jgi:hypothetical protein